MDFMMAFGWIGIMLLIGMFLRAKIPFLRNMLVPASVIGGIIGIVFINVAEMSGIDVGTDTSMFTIIVNNLFTISFISISLTSVPKDEPSGVRNMLKGTIGLGIVWCLLYALTPLLNFDLFWSYKKAVGNRKLFWDCPTSKAIEFQSHSYALSWPCYN